MSTAPRAAFIWLALGLALALAVFAAPWASQAPDGLEKNEAPLGLHETGGKHGALLPDYTVPGLQGPVSTGLAGLVGTVAAFCLAMGVILLIARRAPLPPPVGAAGPLPAGASDVPAHPAGRTAGP
ncbi:MAG: PDGLE domain-containing protein [Planctomycetota bacterium]